MGEGSIALIITPARYHRLVNVDFTSWHERCTFIILGAFLIVLSAVSISGTYMYPYSTVLPNKLPSFRDIPDEVRHIWDFMHLNSVPVQPYPVTFPATLYHSMEIIHAWLLRILPTYGDLLYTIHLSEAIDGPLVLTEHDSRLYLHCHNTCLLLLRTISGSISLSKFPFSTSWWSRTRILR